MKKIAVINDLSGFGKCSLSAALPIISAHKIQCCPLPTGIFSNQTGYESFKSVSMTPYLRDFTAEWKKLGVSFDGILTGFIPDSVQGEIILEFIDEFKSENTLLAVDPIMGDDGEIYPCYNGESIAAVKALAEKADLITPNVTELALLCGDSADASYSVNDIETKCKTLGNKYIVVTGIELENGLLGNAVYDGERFEIVKAKKLGLHFSGTGDIFSAFVTSECVNATDIFTAVQKASAFIEKAIELTDCDKSLHYNADGIDFEQLICFV